MAKPKVFVSSTCYDLQQIRDSLCSFIRNFGFEPVLSENGDVFYHPDLHTHEACVNEVSNCQLFLLIIGGRFGGNYVYDKTKSITNAEYDAAVNFNIPVFTYIKRNVLDNHHLYQENKDKPFINELSFPAIDKQNDALNIFKFINQVRKASVNNAYEPFDIATDIENHLRKQLAAMFFDFLKNREVMKQIDHTSKSVDSLVVTTDKLEELVKSLYVSVDEKHATKQINLIQARSMAKTFLVELVAGAYTGVVNAKTETELEELASIDPNKMNWHQYLSKLTLLEPVINTSGNVSYHVPFDLIDREGGKLKDGYTGINIEPKNSFQQEYQYLYENGVCRLDRENRLKLITSFAKLKSEFD